MGRRLTRLILGREAVEPDPDEELKKLNEETKKRNKDDDEGDE